VTVENPPEKLDVRTVWVWGVPFAQVTTSQTLTIIDQLIATGRPHFIITANLHYAMLAATDARLRANNQRAALILADGMPIVWASRWRAQALPERVTGSDLFPMLCARAAERGYGIYLLGAAPGVAEEAARRLRAKHANLRIVGVQSPPFREMTLAEQEALAQDIRQAKPDLLFVAFGQPKGEYWVAEWYQKLGVPVVMQVGASIDFAAGRVTRAPRWMQRIGLEWTYRFLQEPFRLGGRYAANAWFACKMVVQDLVTRRANRR
jgi:N-acetylglucosaminyldiphosphoundecaprenol N-acetyl-beta-D-mannosaminyltransferase